jgi:hypothetical protein
MAPAVLGLPGAPFHDPFHAYRRASSHGTQESAAAGTPPGTARGQGGHRAGRSAPAGDITPPGPRARRPGPHAARSPARYPARITTPGWQRRSATVSARFLHRDARRRHQAGDRGPHRPPDPARCRTCRCPGSVQSVTEPHDHLDTSRGRPRRTICDHPVAIRA